MATGKAGYIIYAVKTPSRPEEACRTGRNRVHRTDPRASWTSPEPLCWDSAIHKTQPKADWSPEPEQLHWIEARAAVPTRWPNTNRRCVSGIPWATWVIRNYNLICLLTAFWFSKLVFLFGLCICNLFNGLTSSQNSFYWASAPFLCICICAPVLLNYSLPSFSRRF